MRPSPKPTAKYVLCGLTEMHLTSLAGPFDARRPAAAESGAPPTASTVAIVCSGHSGQ
jgi:hypothetical protein